MPTSERCRVNSYNNNFITSNCFEECCIYDGGHKSSALDCLLFHTNTHITKRSTKHSDIDNELILSEVNQIREGRFKVTVHSAVFAQNVVQVSRHVLIIDAY